MFCNFHKINYLYDMVYDAVCYTLVPFYNVPISCGLPNEVGDIPPEMIKVPSNYGGTDVFVVKATGDSMVGVNIHDGDMLMVKQTNKVHNLDVVVVMLNGESLIKSYYMDDYGRQWLVPANEKYEPILLKENMDLFFCGVVTYNMSPPRDTKSNICKSLERYKEEKQKPKPKRKPTQEEVDEAIRRTAPFVENARCWLAPCRVLMDCGFIAKGRFDIFCNLVNYVLPDLKTKPDKNELNRMAIDCFADPFDTWTDEKAPVHGENYLKYHRAGEAMIKYLP